jgi:hypothetical protein
MTILTRHSVNEIQQVICKCTGISVHLFKPLQRKQERKSLNRLRDIETKEKTGKQTKKQTNKMRKSKARQSLICWSWNNKPPSLSFWISLLISLSLSLTYDIYHQTSKDLKRIRQKWMKPNPCSLFLKFTNLMSFGYVIGLYTFIPFT